MNRILSAVLLLYVITLVGAQTPSPRQKASEVMPQAAAQEQAPNSFSKFLHLAETVGQTAPANRLAEFARRSDVSPDRRYWAIVDFNQPSTIKRFYIFDTIENRVETFYVSHGRGSEGAADDGMADIFTNEHGSNGSSLGIYAALNEYTGAHGRSLRMEGLEATNSNALDRAIVLHPADYASQDFIRKTGRLGRSEGCFAVEPSVSNMLIDKLKGGAYLIAWKK